MKYKLPEGFGSREDAMEAILRKELEEGEDERDRIKQALRWFLIEKKGFSESEIETDAEFEVPLGEELFRPVADIVVSVGGERLMVVKCSPGALVSRERHAVSMARVMGEYVIPRAVVTDAEDAIILDAFSGRQLSEGLAAVPSRDELARLAQSIAPSGFPPERLERERRVFLAFEAIGCSVNYEEPYREKES